MAARCDPYKDPIPAIPDELILRTSQVYIEAFETISGLAFALRGSIDKVTSRVFLLTPADVEVSADDARRLAERGLFRQD